MFRSSGAIRFAFEWIILIVFNRSKIVIKLCSSGAVKVARKFEINTLYFLLKQLRRSLSFVEKKLKD